MANGPARRQRHAGHGSELAVGHFVAFQLLYNIRFKLVFHPDKFFKLFWTFEFKNLGFFLSADFLILLNGE